MVPESDFAGVDVDKPFSTWPGSARAAIESRVIQLLAGELAALMLAPAPARLGRVGPTVVEEAAEQAAALAANLPQPTAADVADLAAGVDIPDQSDAAKIAEWCWSVHGSDHASAALWLGYLECQTKALIMVHRSDIERLAATIAIRGSLSGEAVAALLRA